MNAHGILFRFDSLRWCDRQRGTAHLAGWAFHPAAPPLRAVRAVAGAQRWEGVCGAPRPDVAAAHPECPAAAAAGFYIRVEGLPPGETLNLEAADAGGDWHGLATLDSTAFAAPVSAPEYRYRPPGWEECRRIHARAAALVARPLISVILPTYNTPPVFLRAAIDSVRDQLYENWELCVADDASPDPRVRPLLDEAARADRRIRLVLRPVNGNISAATNSALAIARGEFVALLDHDDELTVDALAAIAGCLNAHPDADIVYSDHDKMDAAGRCVEPHFKPDWSPEYFRGVMYVGHLLCVRRRLLEEIGGFDPAFDGVQDYEAMLRLSERAARIVHLPEVLYHWRMIPGSFATAVDAKPGLQPLQARAVDAQLARLGLPAQAETFGAGHRVRLRPAAHRETPRVSILIPTRDAPDYLERCLRSICERSTYPNYEIVLGDNDTTDPRALGVMERFPTRRVPCPGRFNFSRVNNLCAREASGEFLLLLNNDTEILTPDWIEQMLYFAEQPGVGAVGPLLLFPDHTVQHAGVILGPRGTADHLMRGFPADVDGYAGSLVVSREVSVITAACLLVRRELYDAVGGLNEHYFTHYQDIDFCLELRTAGKRNLFTPNARLLHHESASRQKYYDVIDRHLLLDRWESWIEAGDPYHNPHFDPEHDDYRLRPEGTEE